MTAAVMQYPPLVWTSKLKCQSATNLLRLSTGKVEVEVCKSLPERDEKQDAAWRAVTW